MAITTYVAHALTGENGTRILSELDPANLFDGDQAMAMIGDEVMFFQWKIEATDEQDIELHPYKVRPNSFTGAGVWIEKIVSTSAVILFGKTSPPSAADKRDGTVYIMYE